MRRRRDANSEDLPVLTLSRIERFSDQQAQERGPRGAFRDHAQDTPKTCRPPPSCPRWSTAQPARPRNRGCPSCGLALPWAAPRHPTVLCPVLLVPARREPGMLSCQQAVGDALLSRCRSARLRLGARTHPHAPLRSALLPLLSQLQPAWPLSVQVAVPPSCLKAFAHALCSVHCGTCPGFHSYGSPFGVYLTDGLGLCHIPLPSRPPPPPG